MTSRMNQFGETIFATMTAEANRRHAINLGQGFPDESGPQTMLEIAAKEITAGNNQYAPGRGLPVLREAIAADRARRYGETWDPETEILVTVGATEAIAASIIALTEPGDEVILLEPYYDSYAAAVALAGGKRVSVTIDPATGMVDPDELRRAITPKTKLLVVNSPHNPTGRILNTADIAAVCAECDLTVIADDVYERLTFDQPHIPIRSYPGMDERTVTISSAAKTFSVTGWKTGWVVAHPHLLDPIVQVKQFLTYVGATPFQPAIAYGLTHESAWVDDMVDQLKHKKDRLAAALTDAGLTVRPSDGTYFLLADSDLDSFAFLDRYNIATIPVSAFCDQAHAWDNVLRFTFCKSEATIEQAHRWLGPW